MQLQSQQSNSNKKQLHPPKWFSSTSTEMYGSMSWSSGLPNVILWRFWKSVGRSPEASHTFKRIWPENILAAIRSLSSSCSTAAGCCFTILCDSLAAAEDKIPPSFRVHVEHSAQEETQMDVNYYYGALADWMASSHTLTIAVWPIYRRRHHGR